MKQLNPLLTNTNNNIIVYPDSDLGGVVCYSMGKIYPNWTIEDATTYQKVNNAQGPAHYFSDANNQLSLALTASLTIRGTSDYTIGVNFTLDTDLSVTSYLIAFGNISINTIRTTVSNQFCMVDGSGAFGAGTTTLAAGSYTAVVRRYRNYLTFFILKPDGSLYISGTTYNDRVTIGIANVWINSNSSNGNNGAAGLTTNIGFIIDRYINNNDIYSFLYNPSSLIFKKPSILLQKVKITVAVPISDVSNTDWIPSTGTDLYATVDEEPSNDTDYIYTLSNASPCTLALNEVTDPGTSYGQTIKYRAKSPYGNTLIATLKQDSTVIATRTHTNVPETWTEYKMILTAQECDSITDYSLLRITLEAQV